MKFIPGGPPRFDHQKRALQRLIETGGVTALLMDPGTGKALDVATEVPTPEGWTTMGDLRTGDTVYAPDGSETRIIAHDPYIAETWRLTFSDGTEVVADGAHLWQVESRDSGGRWQPEATRTTADLIQTLRAGGKARHRVRLTAPVVGTATDLPVHPYVLGVWLGDGRADQGTLTLGSRDADEILSRLREAGERPKVTRADRGTVYVSMPSPDTTRCNYGHPRTARVCAECSHSYYERAKYGTPLPFPVNAPLATRLRALGVLGNKHVPLSYLRASRDDRLELLRGLVDTDGYISRGRVEVCLTSRELSEAVRELACSLGERAVLRESVATLRGRVIGPRWRVSWTPRLSSPAHLTRRHLDPRRGSERLAGRYLVDAAPAGRREVRCLTVDSPTGQYLVTRSWLPTHNTATMLDYCSLLALKSPEGEVRVLVVAPLAATDTWALQAEKWVSPQVSVWAEVLGGSILQRGEALASRGGQPFPGARSVSPRGEYVADTAHHWHRARERYTSHPVDPRHGPSAMETDLPRIVLEIINIDTLASRQPIKRGGSRTLADHMVDSIKRFRPELVIVDESHRIKGARTNSSRLLDRVGPHVKRRVILTGTVMPSGPLDVFGQWRFLDPYAFGTPQPDGTIRRATKGSFEARFAVFGGWMGKEVIGYRNLDEMQSIMAKNSVVVRKSDALDLPQTMDVEVPVLLNAAETKAYQQMKAGLAAQIRGGQVTTENRLTQRLRLRQITSGFVTDDSGKRISLGTSKLDTIKSIVHDSLRGEERVVVFSHFVDEIALLEQRLAEPGTTIEVITGETSSKERLEIRRRFGDVEKHPERIVLIAQIRTLSLAVNELVTANHAVYGSLSDQRDDFIQSKDRLDRIGQTRPVTFWFAVAPGTVDEVILKSHIEGTNLEDAMLKHILEGS